MKDNNYLPSAAFKINGTYLEDLVTGYHTLNAKNKWTLEKQINTVDTSNRDGSIYVNSRYPAREIEIEYYIEGNDWDALQASYTALMGILDVDSAEIIFNGEPDKYIRGYFSVENSIEETYWTRKGTFKIICPDPFKYSVTEYTQTASSNTFTVDYNGTYKGYPTLVAQFPETLDTDGDNTNTSECGYIGYANQREDVLQFGDPEETDIGDIPYPATVPVNRTFKSTTGWTLNGSSVITGTQVGSITASTDHMYPSGYGSGTGWHGPSLSYIITGEAEPIGQNYTFSWKQKIAATKKQFGGCEIILWNNDNGTRTLISGVSIRKTTKDTKCKVYLYTGSTSSKKNYTIDVSKIGSCTMEKTGGIIDFNVGKSKNTIVNDDIANLIANEITFHFMRKDSLTVLGSNFIYSCKLQRTEFEAEGDIQNTFIPGQVLTVNTQDATVYLDEGSATIPATYLGALGNDWEDFYLSNGTNTIACDYSDFTTTAPIFTIKYRERFI